MMQSRKHEPFYSLLIFLVLLATMPPITRHPLLRNLLAFSLVFLLVKGLCKQFTAVHTLVVSLLVVTILQVGDTFLCPTPVVTEHFSNEKVESLISGLDKLSQKLDGDAAATVSTSKLSTDEIDDLEDDNNYNNQKGKDVEPHKLTPLDAQKESFKVLSTVRDLKKTVDSLVPTLKSAKDVLDVYKNLRV